MPSGLAAAASPSESTLLRLGGFGGAWWDAKSVGSKARSAKGPTSGSSGNALKQPNGTPSETIEPAELRLAPTEPAELRVAPAELRLAPAELRLAPAELRLEPTEPAELRLAPTEPAELRLRPVCTSEMEEPSTSRT